MPNYQEIGDTFAFHPGYYIEELLDYGGMTLAQFAFQLEISVDKLRDIINGEQDITIELAEKLEEVTGASRKFWLSLQHKYDTQIGRITEPKIE